MTLGTESKPLLIDTIKNGSLVFIYYPDESWLGSSPFLERMHARVRPGMVLGGGVTYAGRSEDEPREDDQQQRPEKQ